MQSAKAAKNSFSKNRLRYVALRCCATSRPTSLRAKRANLDAYKDCCTPSGVAMTVVLNFSDSASARSRLISLYQSNFKRPTGDAAHLDA